MKLSQRIVVKKGDNNASDEICKRVMRLVEKFVSISDGAVWDTDAEHTLKASVVIEDYGNIASADEIFCKDISKRVKQWAEDVSEHWRMNVDRNRNLRVGDNSLIYAICYENEVDGGLTVSLGNKKDGYTEIHVVNTTRTLMRASDEADPELDAYKMEQNNGGN